MSKFILSMGNYLRSIQKFEEETECFINDPYDFLLLLTYAAIERKLKMSDKQLIFASLGIDRELEVLIWKRSYIEELIDAITEDLEEIITRVVRVPNDRIHFGGWFHGDLLLKIN